MLQQCTDLEVAVRGFVRGLTRRTDGASAVEYGLLIALIAVVIIVAVALLGTNLSGGFNRAASSVAAT